MSVSQKTEYNTVNGTPQKRVFLSIINDYDLLTSLCELIDNAIDMWATKGRKKDLIVEIELDPNRQLISVKDNAGGVKESSIESLISPGASGLASKTNTIGIFGVGGKRAGVALGELVEIKSRYRREKSLQIDISKEWLASNDWDMPVYEIPQIPEGTTIVEISKLRQGFDSSTVDSVRVHLSEVYAKYLHDGCTIVVNEEPIKEIHFDNWAYPPSYLPRVVNFDVKPNNEVLTVRITGGLVIDRDPEQDNYGVYIYCNDRLVVKEAKTREVGYFVTTEAGVPHPDASLCRVIVEISGHPSVMPWNSSKNGINYQHLVFQNLHPTLIDLVSYFSKLSRRLKDNWKGEVFAYDSGTLQRVPASDVKESGKLVLPSLPRSRGRPLAESLKDLNKNLISEEPWTLGLIESIGMVDIITRQKLETKNRAALILLDSNLEISLKEFIVHRSDLFPPKQYPDGKIRDLFQSRQRVIREVCKHIVLPASLLRKIDHYYTLRNKLIHERASVGITPREISDYQKVVQQVMRNLFKMRFPSEKA